MDPHNYAERLAIVAGAHDRHSDGRNRIFANHPRKVRLLTWSFAAFVLHIERSPSNPLATSY